MTLGLSLRPQQWDLLSAAPAQGLRVDLLSIHSEGQYVRRLRLPRSITQLPCDTEGLLAEPQVQYSLEMRPSPPRLRPEVAGNQLTVSGKGPECTGHSATHSANRCEHHGALGLCWMLGSISEAAVALVFQERRTWKKCPSPVMES